MKWTTEKPTVSGWYWFYGPTKYDALSEIKCSYMHVSSTGVHFTPLVDGYEWENDFDADDVSYWMGPIELPEPPKLIDEVLRQAICDPPLDDPDPFGWGDTWILTDRKCGHCGSKKVWSTGWHDDAEENGGSCIGILRRCTKCLSNDYV